jgi:hypothetical protein
MKVIINVRYGGFGLSDAAYERLIALGVPVRKYIEEQFDHQARMFRREPANEGRIIFDRELTPPETDAVSAIYHQHKPGGLLGRYWDGWTDKARSDPMIVQVVEELGDKANGPHAKLKVVEIPDDVEWEIEEYDGAEWIAEKHRTWR